MKKSWRHTRDELRRDEEHAFETVQTLQNQALMAKTLGVRWIPQLHRAMMFMRVHAEVNLSEEIRSIKYEHSDEDFHMNAIFRAKHGKNKGDWVKWTGLPYFKALINLVDVDAKPGTWIRPSARKWSPRFEVIARGSRLAGDKNPYHIRMPYILPEHERRYLFERALPAACLGGAYFELCYDGSYEAECPTEIRVPVKELDQGHTHVKQERSGLLYEAKREMGGDYDEDIITSRFDREHNNSRAHWRLRNFATQRYEDDYPEAVEKENYAMPSASQKTILQTPLTYVMQAIGIVGNTTVSSRYEDATSLRIDDAQMLYEFADGMIQFSDEIWGMWIDSVLSGVKARERLINKMLEGAGKKKDAKIPTGSDSFGQLYDYMRAEKEELADDRKAGRSCTENISRKDMCKKKSKTNKRDPDMGLAWLMPVTDEECKALNLPYRFESRDKPV